MFVHITVCRPVEDLFRSSFNRNHYNLLLLLWLWWRLHQVNSICSLLALLVMWMKSINVDGFGRKLSRCLMFALKNTISVLINGFPFYFPIFFILAVALNWSNFDSQVELTIWEARLFAFLRKTRKLLMIEHEHILIPPNQTSVCATLQVLMSFSFPIPICRHLSNEMLTHNWKFYSCSCSSNSSLRLQWISIPLAHDFIIIYVSRRTWHCRITILHVHCCFNSLPWCVPLH